ncbi:hypothetical protein HOLleu_05373 [Holothuria leucospilota]|uniref:Uncharacterized protein n=1 Tax=Holothuria leucospilota TaxID=206669 RepID=A0A9Q1CKM2_HOLLE|nr:hypothetical protein HOLleu_05373 [Holothuria leucospilota]
MATQSDLITKAAEGALEDIKKYAPEEYKKLEADPAIKDKILQAAKATAKETLMLAEFTGHPHDFAEKVTKHLPEERVKLIQGALNIPTFRMKIIKKDNGRHWLELTREGQEFKPTRELASYSDIDWATIEQYASILIEAVLLVMSAVGISVSPSASVIRKTVDETAESIRSSSQLQRALETFVEAWDAAGNNPTKMATALFNLIKDSYSAGILWNIIKSLCSNMAWYDWVETSAKVSAMIIAALATDGVALIAEIALVVFSAVDFARKIANVVQLQDVKKGL